VGSEHPINRAGPKKLSRAVADQSMDNLLVGNNKDCSAANQQNQKKRGVTLVFLEGPEGCSVVHPSP